MQDIERLIQLLEAQEMHLEPNYPHETGVEIEASQRMLCNNKSRLEEAIEKTNENARKIVEAVKTYLVEYPFVYHTTIRNALKKFDKTVGCDRVTGEQLSVEKGGKKIILYRRTSYDYFSYFSAPVSECYGGLVCNESFTEDPDIGYLLLSRGLAEILTNRREKFPYRLQVRHHPFAIGGKTINFDKDRNISRQSLTSRIFIIYKDSYSKMLEELSKEMDRWISGSETGKSSEDLLFKKVEKRKGKK